MMFGKIIARTHSNEFQKQGFPHMHIIQLISDLGIEMIFGKMIARTHSNEFQKQGFPHMHIIFG